MSVWGSADCLFPCNSDTRWYNLQTREPVVHASIVLENMPGEGEQGVWNTGKNVKPAGSCFAIRMMISRKTVKMRR